MPAARQVFLLSPANCAGKRAGYLLRDEAGFDLARRLRSAEGAAIGEVFSFMSGLYFRGKLAYSRVFAKPPEGLEGIHVIVPGHGLLSPDYRIGLAELREIAAVPVDPGVPQYLEPLQHDVRMLHGQLAPADAVILLGSVATQKYLGPLAQIIGDRLRYPADFVGRGDMSRGSIMLKCAAAGRELDYVRAAAAA